ncbi:hypothetical protein CTA1_6673 [Colletotrichum tanaceti]|uniref:Uncharacterized protein n=1 Tax=Colletotrichum tanaceti TaxID=1306861 RepID=A0A4U6WY48_9PEZI|nr:hypothetical protein CTA1_6673 [Colletotrichum tanaceti]
MVVSAISILSLQHALHGEGCSDFSAALALAAWAGGSREDVRLVDAGPLLAADDEEPGREDPITGEKEVPLPPERGGGG